MKTINQLTNKDFFYCYDVECSKFLKEKGIPYLLKAKSIKDNKIFTMYIRNAELSNALLEYKLKLESENPSLES